MAMAAGLSIIARGILWTGLVSPIVLGLVWLFAFLWCTGWIIAGPHYADHLAKVTFGFIAGCLILAGAIAFVS